MMPVGIRLDTDCRIGGAMEIEGADELLHGPAILSLGADLKSTVCTYRGGRAAISEDLGNLNSPRAFRDFVQVVQRMTAIVGFTPDYVAHDMHPLYESSRFAMTSGWPTIGIQHHHAHVVSVMGEWGFDGEAVGVACDGIGYGMDGAAWGCEILRCDGGGFERMAHLRYFPLVGGDLAAKQTWRPAAALIRQAYGPDWRQYAKFLFAGAPDEAMDIFDCQIVRGLNAPMTSSLGRIFDGVAALIGLCDENRYEGEAAMKLDAAAHGAQQAGYPFGLPDTAEGFEIDLAHMIVAIMEDLSRGRDVPVIAARFHETMAQALSESAGRACESAGLNVVALAGGCFANRLLLGRTVALLEARRIRVLLPCRLPFGDGGLSFGQAVAAAAMLQRTA